MTSPINFKYTIPVTKSDADDDGLYIEGAATGPEVDLQGERIAPEAIEDFARQIKERYEAGDPIPYYDEHEKMGGRSVLKHLGDLVDGSITDKGHLWVRVRLNEDNPAATFLYRQVQKGKKYGMSVSGDVPNDETGYVDELVKSIGRKVRTFKKVILTHIANTTRPVWTPSLGTVLNRAVEKALSEGETMAEETVVESTEATKETTTETPAESTIVEATETKVEETTTKTPAEAPEATNALEQKMDALINAFTSLAEALKPQTPAPVVQHSEETPEPEISKSEDDRVARLEAELEQLKERSATQRPPILNKAEETELNSLLKSMSPEERLRLAFAVTHGEEI